MKTKLIFCCLVLSALLSCKKEHTSTDTSSPQTVTTTNVNNSVVAGTWRVTYYFDTDHDSTSRFAGYAFVFASNGVVTATRSGDPAITGTWSTGADDSQVKLVLSFSTPASFANISDDWHVTERTDTKITLQDVSGGNGGTDYLTFEKN